MDTRDDEEEFAAFVREPHRAAPGKFDDPAPLLVYDVASRQVVSVEHRGEVTLPAN